MRSKDLKIGQRVAVFSTQKVESYTRVHEYEVLDTRPWASTSRYSRFGARLGTPPTPPEVVALPEGVNWPSHIRTSPETGWRSTGYGSAPAALLVQVHPDGEGGETYGERPTLVSLGQIKGEFEEVRREVVAAQDIMLRQAQDRQAAAKARRDRYAAAVQDAVDAGLIRNEYAVSQRGSNVTVPLDLFERLISDALTLQHREQG